MSSMTVFSVVIVFRVQDHRRYNLINECVQLKIAYGS